MGIKYTYMTEYLFSYPCGEMVGRNQQQFIIAHELCGARNASARGLPGWDRG